MAIYTFIDVHTVIAVCRSNSFARFYKRTYRTVVAGWQELVNKYWFLSVSLRYRSVTIFRASILHDVSRKAKVSEALQPHSGLSIPLGVVCVIVN